MYMRLGWNVFYRIIYRITKYSYKCLVKHIILKLCKYLIFIHSIFEHYLIKYNYLLYLYVYTLCIL